MSTFGNVNLMVNMDNVLLKYHTQWILSSSIKTKLVLKWYLHPYTMHLNSKSLSVAVAETETWCNFTDIEFQYFKAIEFQKRFHVIYSKDSSLPKKQRLSHTMLVTYIIVQKFCNSLQWIIPQLVSMVHTCQCFSARLVEAFHFHFYSSQSVSLSLS